MYTKSKAQSAFTLIELMTATGLTVVMLLLMAGLYSQTADIIRAGIATSDNIERSRAATRELVGIFDYMIPPSAIDTNSGLIDGLGGIHGSAGNSESPGLHGGGMLVITNKLWSARGLYGPDSDSALNSPLSWLPQVNSKREGLIADDIRSDMMSFFVYNNVAPSGGASEALNLPSLTPGQSTYFTSNSENEARCTVAKVWIGHTQLVGPEGQIEPAIDNLSRSSSSVRDHDDPLQKFDPVIDSFGAGVANEWVLGMQYMLTGFTEEATPTMPHYNEILDTKLANTGDPLLAGYGASTAAYTEEAVFHAASDFADYSFNNPTVATTENIGLLIGDGVMDAVLKPNPDAVTVTGATSDLRRNNNFSSGMVTDGDYKANALAMTYVNNRLFFNRAPGLDLEAYWVAQTHPGFMPYCAEIVIEFAADCDMDGEIDREGFTDLYGTGGEDADSPIDNHDHDGNDEKNVDINWNGIDDDGSIIWYSAFQSVNSSGHRLGPSMRPHWKIESSVGAGDGYRQMPDVRRNSHTDFPFNNADYAFVWRHDHPENWPWLIRIRLRLMSRSGILEFDPREPQYDFKKRRLDPNNNYLPQRPTDYDLPITDDYSQFDGRDISYGVGWNGADFQDMNDRLPGTWYEFIVPVRRE